MKNILLLLLACIATSSYASHFQHKPLGTKNTLVFVYQTIPSGSEPSLMAIQIVQDNDKHAEVNNPALASQQSGQLTTNGPKQMVIVSISARVTGAPLKLEPLDFQPIDSEQKFSVALNPQSKRYDSMILSAPSLDEDAKQPKVNNLNYTPYHISSLDHLSTSTKNPNQIMF